VAFLQKLELSKDIKKRDLYRACRGNGPVPYPLNVTMSEPASPSLLDRVQDRPAVESNLRVLKRQRTKERGKVVYIKPQAKSSLQDSDDARFPLMDKVKESLKNGQKVFLLLGDSGAGKSTFCRELESDLWKSYESKTGRIPLHINLLAIDKPETDMIAKQLKRDEFTEPQIRELKQYRKFILICDGYESQQAHNLYVSNRLNQTGEWDAQMVISCRSEYLGDDYRDRFQPRDHNKQSDSSLFQEAIFMPFSTDEIQEYIKEYVSLKQHLRWCEKDYKQALENIPSLMDLVKNPFLMALSLDVLPSMVAPGQHLSIARISRVKLYDRFVNEWLEKGKKRLSEMVMPPQMKKEFEKLSAEGFTLNGIEYLKRFAVAIYKTQGGDPVVEYFRPFDEGSWKDDFFARKEKQVLHEACPLTRSGNQHRFIHQSLLEYALARAVFDPQDKKNRAVPGPVLSRRGSTSRRMSFELHSDMEEGVTNPQGLDPPLPLFWRSFVNDHSLLQFLEERVQDERDQDEPVFKNQLLAYIEYSKTNKKWRTAAANAITILVRAGVQFIGTDLRGIQIPGADLSHGVFHSAQLQEADMRKVNLRGAWLQQTDLSQAYMIGVQFGELPHLSVGSPVTSCAFSRDEKLLAIGLEHGSIKVYSTTTWDKIPTSKEDNTTEYSPDGKRVQGVVFSLDGSMIVSGSKDGTVRIWHMDSEDDRPTYVNIYTSTDHTGAVNCVAYSPHGEQVASARSDETIRLWNPLTGESCILSGHQGGVLCVAYSPKGDQIVSGSTDFTVRLWNVETGDCTYTFNGHGDEVWSIAFSPCGDQIASAGNDKTIRLWDMGSRECSHILEGHTNKVNDVLYSVKGDQIISGSSDGTVRVWDVQSGTCRHRMTGHGREVNCIAYSPKDGHVASGGADEKVRLWDVSIGGSGHISSGHSQKISDVRCSPKGDLIASCSLDRTIRLWDAKTGTCLGTLRGHQDAVSCIAFSPQGNQIASGSPDKTVRLWNVETRACQYTLTGHTSEVFSIAYTPQGGQVASVSHDETVRLWTATTGEHEGTLNHYTNDVTSVAYSPDGKRIATEDIRGNIMLWDVKTRALVHTLPGQSDYARAVVFSPQGDQLASASNDWIVRLWDVVTGVCRWELTGHINVVQSVAYSHNGYLLASGSRDKTVLVWDVKTGQCRAQIQNLQRGVLCVAWIPSTDDAYYLVTGCEDGVVLKWRVTEGEGQSHDTPCWIATRGSLTATKALIKGVRGLSSDNDRLLKQRIVEAEPGNPTRKASYMPSITGSEMSSNRPVIRSSEW